MRPATTNGIGMRRREISPVSDVFETKIIDPTMWSVRSSER